MNTVAEASLFVLFIGLFWPLFVALFIYVLHRFVTD